MMTPETNESGLREFAEFIAAQATAVLHPEVQTIQKNNKQTPIAFLLDKDGCVQAVDLSHLKKVTPDRIDDHYTFLDIPSFIGYVNEHKNDDTRIFADIEKGSFEAIIDFHGKDKPNWCEHRATLNLKKSAQYNLWSGGSGKLYHQADFSEFLKDHRLDISQPSGSQIAELVMALEATASSTAVGKLRTNQGMHIQFQEDVKTNIPVPEHISIAIPLFVGSDPIEIQADFKFRIGSGEIKFGYRLLAIDMVVRDAITQITDHIAATTELPVFI